VVEEKEKTDPKKAKDYPALVAGRDVMAGTDLAANIIVGMIFGGVVHKYWEGGRPWALIVFLILGVVTGFYQLFKRESMRGGTAKKKVEDDDQR